MSAEMPRFSLHVEIEEGREYSQLAILRSCGQRPLIGNSESNPHSIGRQPFYQLGSTVI